mgnify:FL=1
MMVNLVDIQRVSSTKFIAYATSYLNPLSDMMEVSREISSIISSPCELLFDLLLANGDSFNRYAICKFDGKNILCESIDIIEEDQIDDTSKHRMVEYYRAMNKARYTNSALSMYEIGRIMNRYNKSQM